MVAAKPDCTGQRFGLLTVLGKGDRVPYGKTSIQLWQLQCDCGKIIQRKRQGFDRKQSVNPSCGCAKKQRCIALSQTRAKPNCVEQRFGFLTVIGKAEIIQNESGRSRGLWLLQCDCGQVIKLPRGDFDRVGRGQRSCGCQKHIGGRKPWDIAKQRFGSLVAVALTGRKYQGKPTWLLQCDCGGSSERSLSSLDQGWKLNCGAAAHLPGAWYPPAPSPYPSEAGALVVKYLHLTRVSCAQVNAAVEDWKRERLERVAWIVTYRRHQGEVISEMHESRYIQKCLRYASMSVHRRRKLERDGGLSFTSDNKAIRIGSVMTDSTSQNEPVIETQAENVLSMVKPSRRLKYRKY